VQAYQAGQLSIVKVTMYCVSDVHTQTMQIVCLGHNICANSARNIPSFRRFFNNEMDFAHEYCPPITKIVSSIAYLPDKKSLLPKMADRKVKTIAVVEFANTHTIAGGVLAFRSEQQLGPW
jgi:hypothetical protein